MSSDPPASSDIPSYSDWSASADWTPAPADLPAESRDVPAGPTDVPAELTDVSPGPADVLPVPADVLPVPADVSPVPADVPEQSTNVPPVPADTPETDAPETGRPRGRSWRFLVSPRWLGWHLLMIGLVLGMLALGDWQLRRAESGNALSWAYTFEWPIFAGFVIVFWAKTIRDEFSPPAWLESRSSAAVKLPGGAVVAGSGAGTGGDEDEEEDDEELADYNAYLARLTTEVRGHGKWHGLR